MDSTKAQDVLVLDGLTQEAIRSQLSRILSSSCFLESPSASRFLRFVVEAVLSGQVHQIKQYTIAVDVFGYPPDFDPKIDSAIRVLAGRLRALLKRYYLHEGTLDDIRIEIPKNTYVPSFRCNSMLQTEALSGIPQASLPAATLSDHDLSVAVIPFTNQSLNENNAFTNNITESIVMGLAQFHELCVVGPLVEYNDRAVEISEVFKRYNVRFVLQGRVQMHDDLMRIKVSLTDTRTGFKRWSQTYEYTRGTTNLLEIEDDITRRVVSDLADYNGIIPCLIIRESMKKRTDCLEIHEAIYRYEHFLKVFTKNSYFEAVEALEHAAKVDSGNPIVLAMLSNAYCHNYLYDLALKTATLEKATYLARTAVELDPENPFAHLSEAIVLLVQGQTDRCIAKLKIITSLNPVNAYVLYGCGALYSALDHWETGIKLWKEAMRLNPNYPFIVSSLVPFMYYYVHGNYEEARKYAMSCNSGNFWDPLIRAAVAGQMGLHDEATSALRALLKTRPDFPSCGCDLMQRSFSLKKHVDLLLDGLLKAGLELKP